MTLVLDAGALIGYEAADSTVRAFLTRASESATPVRTASGVVAQVWRNGARQARLAMLLAGVQEVELSRPQARRVGRLLAEAGLADVIDGSVVDVAVDGDEILTSDADDIATLAVASGKTLIITPV